jgi:hypothetical protein
MAMSRETIAKIVTKMINTTSPMGLGLRKGIS